MNQPRADRPSVPHLPADPAGQLDKPMNRQLPRFKVVLHQSNMNDLMFVVRSVMELMRFPRAEATYKMWAVDAGVKRNGLAINGQLFFRWVDNFAADGPLPLDSMYDRGFELSASYFVVPKKIAVYARGSKVYGHFNDSWEYGAGAKWHFLPTERMWLTAELMNVHKAPYSGAFTPYTSGLTGWVPMIQAILAF